MKIKAFWFRVIVFCIGGLFLAFVDFSREIYRHTMTVGMIMMCIEFYRDFRK